MLRKTDNMQKMVLNRCHDGEGDLICQVVLDTADSQLGIRYMHHDWLEPGASIGEHLHQGTEELYFIVSGSGLMLLDGKCIPVGPGDVSLVESGHTHGITNNTKNLLEILVLCV